MRQFSVLLILCLRTFLAEAKKEGRIYRLDSGEYGFALLSSFGAYGGELEIETFNGLKESKNDISEDESTSSKNRKFTENEMLRFDKLIWIRLPRSEETEESIALDIDDPKVWLPIRIVKRELSKKNRILLQLELGEKVEICYKKVDETGKEVAAREYAYSNQTTEKLWIVLPFNDHADDFVPQENSLGCKEFHRVKDVYVKNIFADKDSVLKKRCTFPRLIDGWKDSSIFLMLLVVLDYEIEHSIIVSEKASCLDALSQIIFSSTKETVASASHDATQQDGIQQQSGKNITTGLGIEHTTTLLRNLSVDGIEAWIATPKLANYKGKRMFATGNFKLGLITLKDVYLEGKEFDVNETDMTKSMLGVTYVDLAVDLSKTNLSVDRLVSSKYNNVKNGLEWIRMIVKSINQNVADQSISLELIKGYEVYMKFPREEKPLLAFGMISLDKQSWVLWIQNIRTNGKVESMKQAYESLIQDKEKCEIGLRDADNYKKPTKKFYLFGKSAVNFVSVKLDSTNKYWAVGVNQRVIYIDDSSVDAIGQLVPIEGQSKASQSETL